MTKREFTVFFSGNMTVVAATPEDAEETAREILADVADFFDIEEVR